MDEEVVSEGARLRLSCRITGQPRPRVAWYFNGRPLDTRRTMASVGEGPGEFWLELPSVRWQDAGVYAVLAENCEGRVESSCRVTVLPRTAEDGADSSAPLAQRTLRASPIPFAPRFTGSFSESLDVQEGDRVTFICAVQGHPRPQVSWHKDGTRLHSNDFVVLSEVGDEHRLVMQLVSLEHAGRYSVEAANSVGRSQCQCLVRVTEAPADVPDAGDEPTAPVTHPASITGVDIADAIRSGADQLKRSPSPPEFKRLFRDEFCRPGDRVALECGISAWPQPEVTWSFNGQPIRSGDVRFEVDKRGEAYRLIVLRAMCAESGRYSVTAENDSGIATCSGLLIVHDSDEDGDRAARIAAAVNGSRMSAGGTKTEWVIFHHQRGMSALDGGRHRTINGGGSAIHVRPWRP